MIAHPVHQTDIVPGSDVSFSVTATSIIPLSYQWQKDGVDLTDGGRITGATTATLTITGIMESDEGGYRCVVTNDAGPVTSITATLTVGKLDVGMENKELAWRIRTRICITHPCIPSLCINYVLLYVDTGLKNFCCCIPYCLK